MTEDSHGAPEETGSVTRAARMAGLLLALMVLATAAWFHHPAPGWNVNSRLALTVALVERGTVRVDDLVAPGAAYETNDVAEFGGHAYSDKIIGTSLLGVPALAAVRAAEAVRGEPFPVGARRHAVTALSVGLAAAAAAYLLFRLLLLWGAPAGMGVGGAALVTGCGWLGTMLMPYSTLFMSYVPAVAFLLGALLVFEARPSPAAPSAARWFVIGLLLGCAVLCEYTAAMAAGLAWLYMVSAAPRDAWRAWPAVLGGLVALAPFLAYTWSIFGRFAIPYQYERMDLFREQMAKGFMGLGRPRAAVAALVTVLPYRGIFVHSPLLALGAVGALAGLLRGRGVARRAAALCAAMAVAYVLFNSAYYMWWGGWSFSARHMAPAIPFLILPVALVWRHRPVRMLLVPLAAVGVFIHVVVVAVDPQPPDLNRFTTLAMLLEPSLANDYAWLFFRHILPQFRLGDLGGNLGLVAGLDGAVSLVPLFAVWALCGAGIALLARRGAR